MRQVYIYALCEPNTDEVRYIGQATNVQTRINGHWSESRIYNSPKCQWLRSLAAKGEKPSIKTLAIVDLEQSPIVEKEKILEAIASGANLLNVHMYAAGSLAIRKR